MLINTNTKEIIITQNDLNEIRFLDDRSIIISDFVLSFACVDSLVSCLEIYTHVVAYYGECCISDEYERSKFRISEATNDERDRALSCEDAFIKAVGQYVHDCEMRGEYQWSNVKIGKFDEQPLYFAVISCEDALYYAKHEAVEHEVFPYMVDNFGFEWWVYIVGVEKAVELMKYFYENMKDIII